MCNIIYIFKFKIPSTVIVIMEKINFVKKNQLEIHAFFHWTQKNPCNYTI